jgi:hypothetical protein
MKEAIVEAGGLQIKSQCTDETCTRQTLSFSLSARDKRNDRILIEAMSAGGGDSGGGEGPKRHAEESASSSPKRARGGAGAAGAAAAGDGGAAEAAAAEVLVVAAPAAGAATAAAAAGAGDAAPARVQAHDGPHSAVPKVRARAHTCLARLIMLRGSVVQAGGAWVIEGGGRSLKVTGPVAAPEALGDAIAQGRFDVLNLAGAGVGNAGAAHVARGIAASRAAQLHAREPDHNPSGISLDLSKNGITDMSCAARART